MRWLTLITTMILTAFVFGCGSKKSKDSDTKDDDSEQQSLLELYTGAEAQACHDKGLIADTVTIGAGFEVVCSDAKLSDVECTPENLKTLVIDEDAEKIEASVTAGSQLLQCEDFGAGVRVDWYSDNSVGGATKYRFNSSNISGTYKSSKCSGRATLSLKFDGKKFTRIYTEYPDDDCKEDVAGVYTTEGTVTASMSTEKIGSQYQYLFDLKIEKYTINVADTASVAVDDFETGCLDDLVAATDLVLTAEDNPTCLKTEYIKSIYNDDFGGKYGFAFASRDGGWKSTKDERVSAGFSSADFEMYKEGFTPSVE